MINQSDILIIGAGPAGIYLGWQLAKKGRSVIILESDSQESVGSKMDQFHMDSFAFEEFGVPKPDPNSDEYITTFDTTIHNSPSQKFSSIMKWSVTVMRFQYFINRLIKLAQDDGVKFEFSVSFKKCIIREDRLVGVIAEKNSEGKSFFGRIIVDASGSSAIIRQSLPPNYGVENFKIEDDEKMYVIQRVVQWERPDDPYPGKETKSNTWMYYKTWVAAHFLPNANIFGGGQPGGFKNTEKAAEIFLKNISFPSYKILEEHRATTVYRRSPYSLVGDGFLCLGDSACMTKAFSGEGISLTWAFCTIATAIINRTLQKSDYICKEDLWEINVQYFRNDGAKLAALLAQIPGAANTSKKEMEYLYKRNIIFSGRDFEDMNKYNELQIGFGRMLKIIIVFLFGLLTGQFSKTTLSSILKYMKISGKIRKHYENYPENPLNFEEWVEKADDLWNPVEKMKFTLKA